MKTFLLALLAALTLVLAPAATAASTFTVTTTTDSSTPCASGGGVCSLRGAVLAANASPGATIVLPASGTPQVYSLTLGELYVTSSVTLQGAGSGTSVIEQHGDRVFELNPPASGTVAISGVEITGGVASAPSNGPAQGGGILIDGTASGVSVSLSQVLIDHNSAPGASGSMAVPDPGEAGHGAGIAANGGTLTITDSTISDNATTGGNAFASTAPFGGGDGDGGGLYYSGSAAVTVTGSTISANTATGGTGSQGVSGAPNGGTAGASLGGGVYDAGSGALTATGDTIDGNTLTGGTGGGSLGGSGGIGGDARGAGIYGSSTAALTVTGSTIDGDTAMSGAGGFGGLQGGQSGFAAGGGIASALAGTVTVTNTTISGDHLTGAGGGASISNSGGNGGGAEGGGLQSSGPLTMSEDTVAGDSATGGAGGNGTNSNTDAGGYAGGVEVGDGGTIDASTFSADTAAGGGSLGGGTGGAIETSYPAPVTILNSTIVGNTATGSPEGTPDVADGGALYAATNTTLASDTIADNTAAKGGNGGDVYISSQNHVHAEDTIIAGGAGAAGAADCYSQNTGAMTDLAPGHNIEIASAASPACGFSSAGGDLLVAPSAAGLATALAANGGPTQTLLLAPNSPLRGAGAACIDPSKTGSPPLTEDQRAEPRGSVCDIGALQTEVPQNTAAPKISGKPVVDSKLTCGDGTWIGDGTLAFTDKWLRDGAPVTGASGTTYAVGAADLGHAVTCAVTASSTYGTGSATSAGVTISKPLRPALTGVSQAAKTWREANRAAQISRKRKQPPVGTTFGFRLNEAAKVSLAFTQPVGGRRVNGKCVAQTKRNRHARRCTLKTLTRAKLTVAGRAGQNKLKFYGRTSPGHRLKPGTYTVAIVAVAGGGSSAAQRLKFTIVK